MLLTEIEAELENQADRSPYYIDKHCSCGGELIYKYFERLPGGVRPDLYQCDSCGEIHSDVLQSTIQPEEYKPQLKGYPCQRGEFCVYARDNGVNKTCGYGVGCVHQTAR